jgi:hypothetical protein
MAHAGNEFFDLVEKKVQQIRREGLKQMILTREKSDMGARACGLL